MHQEKSELSNILVILIKAFGQSIKKRVNYLNNILVILIKAFGQSIKKRVNYLTF